jgi:hypothetical protein
LFATSYLARSETVVGLLTGVRSPFYKTFKADDDLKETLESIFLSVYKTEPNNYQRLALASPKNGSLGKELIKSNFENQRQPDSVKAWRLGKIRTQQNRLEHTHVHKQRTHKRIMAFL